MVPRTKVRYYPKQHKEYRNECYLEASFPRFLRCGVIWIEQWPWREFRIAMDAMSAITRCSTRAPRAVNFHRVRMILVCLVRTCRLTMVAFTATTLTRPVPIAARLACINSTCNLAICRLRRCNWFILLFPFYVSTNSGHKDRSNEDRRRILGGYLRGETILCRCALSSRSGLFTFRESTRRSFDFCGGK